MIPTGAPWDKAILVNECWEWMASRNKGGYGILRLGQKSWLAHRLAYSLSRGGIPKGKDVLHTCDNCACINPSHLWIGTQADNMHDMMRKGRAVFPVGERNGSAKLTLAQVKEARSLAEQGWSQPKIAKHFGVSHSTIGGILRCESWGNVTRSLVPFKRLHPVVTKPCDVCGQEIAMMAYRAKRKRFCSRKCVGLNMAQKRWGYSVHAPQ